MKKIFLLLTVAFAGISCNSIMGTIMGANRNHMFESREAIANHYLKKRKLEKEKIYFFDDKEQMYAFMADEGNTADIPYYGLAVNDSLKVDDSSMSNRHCIGVVEQFVTGDQADRQYVPSGLKGQRLTNYLGQPLNLNGKNPTVVFIVHTNMGRVINMNVGYVVKNIKEDNVPVDYVFIALDDAVRQDEVANKWVD